MGASRLSEIRKYAPKVIKAESIDPKFKYEIMRKPGGEKISLCFQCGTCSADCAIARFSDFYKPRKIARLVQLGLKERIFSDDALWLCARCFTCIDNCPQGVDVSGIIQALRNMLVREKKEMPSVYKLFASNILKTGYVYEIPSSRLKRRETKGLPPLPQPNLKHIAKIFDATDFSALDGIKVFDSVKARNSE